LPDRLVVPERLYGRASEIATLVDSFERVARDGRQALFLASGHPGVGKSSIVNELQQVVISRRGLFTSGKFEPHARDIPFAPVVRAFRDLVRSVPHSTIGGDATPLEADCCATCSPAATRSLRWLRSSSPADCSKTSRSA
jgi:predicted ATPase